MLSLNVNGISLDLTRDISITMKYASPVFNTIGDHTYPFKIPTTPLNVTILGFKHRIENAGDPYQEFDASLKWNGVLLLQGSLKIIKADSSFYEATLFMDKGDFYYKMKSQCLQQVDFGELAFADENQRINYMNSCSEKFFPARNVAFPMILDLLYLDPPTEDNEQKYINHYDDGILYPTTSLNNRKVIIPMLFLRFVLEKVFAKLGHTWDDTFFSLNPDFNNCLIYNSVDCNEGAGGFFQYPLDKLLLNYHVPKLTIFEFFSGLETFFNLRLFVNSKTQAIQIVSLDDVVNSTHYAQGFKNVQSIGIELSEKITGYSLSMDVDSDDVIMDEISKMDETNVNYVKDAVQSFSDLPIWPGATEKETRFVTDNNCFYRMTSKVWTVFDITSLITFTRFLYKMTKGTALSTKVSSLGDIVHENVRVGNKRANWAETSFRLFFSKTTIDMGYFYAMTGQYQTEDTSLFYHGSKGLFAKQFKSFLDFQMRTKAVKIIAQLDYLELQNLDFTKKHMIAGNMYLLSEVQVSITNNGLKPATIKAFTCL